MIIWNEIPKRRLVKIRFFKFCDLFRLIKSKRPIGMAGQICSGWYAELVIRPAAIAKRYATAKAWQRIHFFAGDFAYSFN